MNNRNIFLNNKLLLIILFIQSYISYEGVVHEFYFDLYDYNLNNKLFENDIYFNETEIFKSSILFDFFKIFKINLHNDFIGYLLYIFSNLTGIYFLIKILKKYLSIENEIYILLIICIFFYSKITLQYSQPVFFSSHTGTPTSLLMPLVFPYIYFFLQNNIKIIISFNILFIFLSLRNYWLLLLITHTIFIYNLLICRKNILNNLIILLTSFGVLLIFLYLNLSLTNQSNEFKVSIIEMIFFRAEGEDNIILQNKLNIFKLFFSFIIFKIILNKIKLNKNIFLLFKISLYLYFFITVLYFLYCYYGYKIIPLKEIIILNPIRAVYLYNIFLLLSFSCLLTTLPIKHLYKVLILFILLFLNIYELTNLNLYLVMFVFLSLTGILFILKKENNFKFIFIIIILYQAMIIVFNQTYKFEINLALKKFIAVDNFEYKNLQKIKFIQNCNDFNLLYLDRYNDEYKVNNKINWYLKKSKFYGDISHFYSSNNASSINEHYERERFIKKLITNRFEYIEQLLNEYNIVVIINSTVPQIQKNNFVKEVGDYMIFYSSKNSKCFK